ncbi:aconitase [Bellilinea caldifistulae]|uniref:Aconitate hydratase n=1 Tax=Bellilinea caldifistulae TaxID=360411 RepID=A0A0P6WVI0_9CHLR|nr:aconitate hydratase AcnA [Bellilinea caldifistulae]KPL73029.1 aconitate hydratase [Bellilinea caldifistulae]GAP10986.1 aconitase [Bellilinea caldifistulae]
MTIDHFSRAILKVIDKEYFFFPLLNVPGATIENLNRLPFSIRILLEGVLRKQQTGEATSADLQNLLNWQPRQENRPTIPIFPGRVVLQDFTGVPVINDLAAMRSALARMKDDPRKVNPVVQVDLVIDHSIQVDYYANPDAYRLNAELEFQRNRERYEFLHWAQKAFKNLRIVPPASGIVHQVNLEYLATVVLTREEEGSTIVFPDTLVGTDSHTTMINGLGVVGWGVGGIEAVAAMLGEPIEIVAPDVIGVRLSGKLREGVTPTDLTLFIIQSLRKLGVVDKFVEFFGPGLDHLALADRAMIANMAPESGATILYFPVDHHTLDYLRLTNRPESLVELVEAYYQAQMLFRTSSTPDPEYTYVLEVDLSAIEPSVAGPRRPQDRIPLSEVRSVFQRSLTAPKTENGFGIPPEELGRSAVIPSNGKTSELKHGSVVIAAITSCTNTSNPFVMMSAGLLAKKAVEKGLKVKPYVKTSLAPGSRVVTDYLKDAGLMDDLEALGFYLVGYGCTTCIGNAGPLPEPIVQAIKENNLVVGAVLSGNRNFEGRISPHTRANFLASPPLVVAYALAGSVDIDLLNEPLGTGKDGQPVFLKDIWPSSQEVEEHIHRHIRPEMFTDAYAAIFQMSELWNQIQSGEDLLYQWDENSTYLQEPPFFNIQPSGGEDILNARVLALLGDSITTDHISPAGSIAVNSPAGQYLISKGVPPSEFNSYGSRRGNDRVMTRGTFANIRLKNQLVPGVEGGFTRHFPSGEQMTIYDAAMRYQSEGVPLIILAGKEYGTGSSRDWAAKGVLLLGVKAVIAESFERIHRSNLAGMGVLPLQFKNGQNAQALGLKGDEIFAIKGIGPELYPGKEVIVEARSGAKIVTFPAIVRLDTPKEIQYYLNGGIMNTILSQLHRRTLENLQN